MEAAPDSEQKNNTIELVSFPKVQSTSYVKPEVVEQSAMGEEEERLLCQGSSIPGKTVKGKRKEPLFEKDGEAARGQLANFSVDEIGKDELTALATGIDVNTGQGDHENLSNAVMRVDTCHGSQQCDKVSTQLYVPLNSG